MQPPFKNRKSEKIQSKWNSIEKKKKYRRKPRHFQFGILTDSRTGGWRVENISFSESSNPSFVGWFTYDHMKKSRSNVEKNFFYVNILQNLYVMGMKDFLLLSESL